MKNVVLYWAGIHDDDRRLSSLRQYAADRGYKISEKEYADKNRDNRPQFQHLLEEAPGKGIAVAIHDLGQLALTPGLQIESILKLIESGIGIVSVVEDLDSSTPEGREFLQGMIKDIESKLNPLPQPRLLGSRNRPGRKPADFDAEEGVRMRLEQGLSYAEVGSELNTSKTTAHCRVMRRILERLELALSDQELAEDLPAGEDSNGRLGGQCGAQGEPAESAVGEEASKVSAGDDQPGNGEGG